MPYISKCSQSSALTKLYKLMMTSCYNRSWENIYFFMNTLVQMGKGVAYGKEK